MEDNNDYLGFHATMELICRDLTDEEMYRIVGLGMSMKPDSFSNFTKSLYTFYKQNGWEGITTFLTKMKEDPLVKKTLAISKARFNAKMTKEVEDIIAAESAIRFKTDQFLRKEAEKEAK